MSITDGERPLDRLRRTRAGAEEPRPRVLYVDDQVGNLTVFKANLRAFVDVTTATSAEDALVLLEREAFPIVVSDQRMTGMKGSEFLAEVRRRHPDSIRMLLTGYTDFDAVVDAINEGEIARVIRKPWERDDMLATLLSASRAWWRAREERSRTQALVEAERAAAAAQAGLAVAARLANVVGALAIVDRLDGDVTPADLERLRAGRDEARRLLDEVRAHAGAASPPEAA